MFTSFHTAAATAALGELAIISAENRAAGDYPVSEELQQRIAYYIDRLDPVEFGIQEPHIASGADGSVGLLWAEADRYVYVDFLTDGRVHYYVRVGNEIIAEAVLSPSLNDIAAVEHVAPYVKVHRIGEFNVVVKTEEPEPVRAFTLGEDSGYATYETQGTLLHDYALFAA